MGPDYRSIIKGLMERKDEVYTTGEIIKTVKESAPEVTTTAIQYFLTEKLPSKNRIRQTYRIKYFIYGHPEALKKYTIKMGVK